MSAEGAKSKGSYRDYYKRNDNDRLANMDPTWFTNKQCLDIGCNSGVVTSRIAQDFHPTYILGIDIDKILINAANSIIKRAKFSLKQEQPTLSSSSSSSSSSFSDTASDILVSKPKSTFFKPRIVSLKASNSNSFHNHDDDSATTISENSNQSNTKLFPYNIEFKCANILSLDGTWTSPYSSLSFVDKEIQPSPAHFDLIHETFDTILCLSVSKWIHLNYGDKGLMQLFHELFKTCHVGGHVIFEFQTWKSYLNKKSLNNHIKSIFPTIMIKPDMFENILINEIGFMVEKRLGASIEAAYGYNRPILVLVKPSESIITHRNKSKNKNKNNILPNDISNTSNNSNNQLGIKGGLISSPAIVLQVYSTDCSTNKSNSATSSSSSSSSSSNPLVPSSSSTFMSSSSITTTNNTAAATTTNSTTAATTTNSTTAATTTSTKKRKQCRNNDEVNAMYDDVESASTDDIKGLLLLVHKDKKVKRKKI